MKEAVADVSLVAYCGLYCGACGKYSRGKCLGCHGNTKAGWCKVRACCISERYSSCADCKDFPDPKGCGKFNNFISRVFGLVFRSDRAACVARIRAGGIRAYADYMAKNGLQTIKR